MWDALTDPERLVRWFLPITGDLHVGGRYSLEDNASPEMWGLGAGWEMGLRSLGEFLAGKLPEGRAADWIANATPEELMAAGRLSAQISDAWTAVIAARR